MSYLNRTHMLSPILIHTSDPTEIMQWENQTLSMTPFLLKVNTNRLMLTIDFLSLDEANPIAAHAYSADNIPGTGWSFHNPGSMAFSLDNEQAAVDMLEASQSTGTHGNSRHFHKRIEEIAEQKEPSTTS